MNESKSPRRHFLKVLGGVAGAAAGGALSGCTLGNGGITNLVVSNVPMNSLQPVSGESIALGRDSGGIYAMSTICTHRGCDISQRGVISFSGVTCGCHGAQFDGNGGEISGPTRGPLEHYRVTVDATGKITIDPSTVVDSSTRAPVAAVA